MATINVIVRGGGDHAKIVLDCLQAQKRNVVALFDPKYTGSLFGVQQKGEYNAAFEPSAEVIIAIGDNATRKKVAEMTSHSFTNAIHPSAIISSYASMGLGNMILQGSIIQAKAKLGNHIIINTGAQVDHDCIIDNFVHLSPRVVLCGTVSISEGAFIGAGSVVIPGRKIGAWAKIGAGSVVVRDIPDYAIAYGNPARVVKFHGP